MSGGTVAAMDVSELDYELPPELIAQHPAQRRDESRLLVYERATGAVRHRRFAELPEELHGELVVVNDTKVVPARIPIDSPRGEVLLVERIGDDLWEGLARPTRKLKAGGRYGPVELLEHLGEGRWRLRLDGEPAGRTPLPRTSPSRSPTRPATRPSTRASPGRPPRPRRGSTSRPSSRPRSTRLGSPFMSASTRSAPSPRSGSRSTGSTASATRSRPETWERIRGAARVLAVGTTTVRVLETLAHGGPLAGRTELFVAPGFASAASTRCSRTSTCRARRCSRS